MKRTVGKNPRHRQTLAGLLFSARKHAGYTLRSAASRLYIDSGGSTDITYQTIQKWELGERTPTWKHLTDYCRMLKVPKEDLARVM